MGHSAESLTTAQNHRKFIEKLATSFTGTVRQKVYIYIMHYPRPIPSMLKTLHSLEKKNGFALWPSTQNKILIRISCGHPPTSLVGGQTSGRIPATLDSTCTVPVYKLICNCK
jgi:hypothetical protein